VKFLIALLLLGGAPEAPHAGAIRVSTAARSLQPGELVVFSITVPERTHTVTLRAFDRDVAAYQIDPTTWRALVGIDLDVPPRAYPVVIDAHGPAGGVATLTYALRVAARRFPTRRLTVDEGFVNPPASEQARIAREAQEMAAIWKAPAGERLWTQPFVRPVPGPANSRFGTRSIFNGQPRNPHGGGDFLSPAGTPVKAPGGGRIVLARSLYFSGNTIIIDHGLGLFSLLAHLSAFDVQEGESVQAGTVVGQVGATGRVTGPHLHWAVRAGGARVDPLSVLALIGR
jgi:murein DD-endopeptidase MepM/ murein hydrolase activator NlpD